MPAPEPELRNDDGRADESREHETAAGPEAGAGGAAADHSTLVGAALRAGSPSASGPLVHILAEASGNRAVLRALEGARLLQRDGRRATARRGEADAELPQETDPLRSFVTSVTRLRGEALRDFQRGLDDVDEAKVKAAGAQVAMLWTAAEGAHAALRPEEGPELPELAALREAVLQGVGTQVYRGEGVAGSPRSVDFAGDLTRHVVDQTREAAWTVKDTSAALALLQLQERTYEQEWEVVGLFRRHPNPWHMGYMRAVVKAGGLDGVLGGFSVDPAHGLTLLFDAQGFLLEHGRVGPGDRVGLLEARPFDGKVRVLQPYGAREIAVELYGDSSFYDAVLLPYNRGLLADIGPEGWVPAGTELVVDPQLVSGRYQYVFAAAALSRQHIDRPYIEADPEGTAIVGTTITYKLRWPTPAAPEDTMRTPSGEPLWVPITQRLEHARLEWQVEGDPAAVSEGRAPESEYIDYQIWAIEDLTGGAAKIEHTWPSLGTHTVRCSVEPAPYDPMLALALGGDPLELRHPQPVLTTAEKTEADWLRLSDPRRIVFEQAETYGEFQQVAERLGISEDELARNPMRAARLGTQYYPEFLLRDLRSQREQAPEGRRRDKLGWQIDALEEAMRQTRGDMRQLTALYVSAEDERTTSIPLTLYIAPDPDDQWPTSLKLWDFTLAGEPRVYMEGRFQPTIRDAIHKLLELFADDAPYPTGKVRFEIDSSIVPDWLAGQYPLDRETLTLETDGGMLLEQLAPAIITVAAVAVGSVVLGPEVALTAFAIYGALAGMVDIIQRLEEGTFEWDLQTGLDLLAIAGGLAVGIAPVVSAVRGVGEVAWLGRVAQVSGYSQLGVMAGVHLYKIAEAADSHDQQKVMEALLAAFIDGALFLVVHKAGQAARAEGAAPFEPLAGGDLPLPRGGPFLELPGLESTAVGTGGRRPPGRPPGERPLEAAPPEGTPERARWQHEQWAGEMAETGLGPRPGVGEPSGPPVGRGTYETAGRETVFRSPQDAFAAYDEALARAGGREVGIYRNLDAPTPEYVVRVGDAHSVSAPAEGRWESVLHRHPNPENVLTRRMPAPQDVHNTLVSAFRSARPVTEFIEYPLPDGRRGLVAYTVEPTRGRVTIKYERADGTQVVRTFETVEAYASHYAERTTYVDPSSPEYQWMMRDLDDFYGSREPSGGATAAGVLRPSGGPAQAGAPEAEPAVETVIEHARAEDQPRGSSQRRSPRTQIPDILGPEAAQVIRPEVARSYREKIAFRTVADNTAVLEAWQRADAHVRRTWLAGRAPTRELMIEMYERVRGRFWIEVRGDDAAAGFFRDGGLVFPEGSDGAPLMQGYEHFPRRLWDELRLSLDHVAPKAQGENWQRAVDPTNLRFLIARDNTMIAALERLEAITMWFGPAVRP